jgi:hypothetical protein
MAKQKMKLFVWEGVLTDYTDGIMFAVAPTVEEARAAIIKKADGLSSPKSECQAEPTHVHDLTESVGYFLYGGG